MFRPVLLVAKLSLGLAFVGFGFVIAAIGGQTIGEAILGESTTTLPAVPAASPDVPQAA